MKDFTEIPTERILYKNDLFFIIEDKYPVNPGHLLIISNKLRKDYFELTQKEKEELPFMIDYAKALIEQKHKPNAYNIGMNCGLQAGQTVFHFHCHIIPRYDGDMEDPTGGVRGVIPENQKY